mmetsp:Transcript_15488/g.46757  ORF Transcript_15488/g.46757 Transcript_15488/m.46757 type:complete len:253 (-) Transcript_15488:449-1207(-)
MAKILSRAPSAMSNVGSGGKKSLPISMQNRTKSSITRSRLYSNGSWPAPNSRSKYSRSSPTWKRMKFSALGFSSTSRAGRPRAPPENETTSRSRQKCGSWVTSASMIRSASSPYRQWRWLGAQGRCMSRRAHRMYSMILCSPSPGTSCPEKMMRGACHTGSLCILWRMKKRRWAPSRAMNAVPGVMQLLSNTSTPSGCVSPLRAAAAAASAASCADRNRLERCWFIFARGALPSMAMNSSWRGCTIWTRRSK